MKRVCCKREVGNESAVREEGNESAAGERKEMSLL